MEDKKPSSANETSPYIPILDLSLASDPGKRPELLKQLHSALFDVGFLYITNHGVPEPTITSLTDLLPDLFNLPPGEKTASSKLNSPHFLGYSGFAEETTQGKQDLREQFDYATELPVVYQSTDETNNTDKDERDFTKLYWRLRGPNQWPPSSLLPTFREALTAYHDALSDLSYRFVHLIEEAFRIPVGTFDHFFSSPTNTATQEANCYLPPQHRIKLLHYPPNTSNSKSDQGVGPHKDSSGWLTFLYQVPQIKPAPAALEVLHPLTKAWTPVPPIPNTFVVNFGAAFEAATSGAVRATIHRVIAPQTGGQGRFSIPFFMGLPLDLTVREIREYIPEHVKALRQEADGKDGEVVDQGFLDLKWETLGESQLRKWIRSHEAVGRKWYGDEVCGYYLQ